MAEEKPAEAKAATEKKPEQKKKDENTRKPSALKRDIQSEQRRQRNGSYRSSVLTAIRGFEASLANKEAPEALKAKLNTVYSLMDKGVKKGVYKPNKAARTKSRLTARAKAT
jgi:small subunit ribosomal protein S20